MSNPEEVIKDLNEKRMRAWEEGKRILDEAAEAKRALTTEEREAFDRVEADIDALDATRERILKSQETQEVLEGLNEEFRRAVAPTQLDEQRQREQANIREFFKRGGSVTELNVDLANAARVHNAYRQGARGPMELRLVGQDSQSSAGGSLWVPTDLENTIYAYMTASVALRRMRTRIVTTDSGNPIDFPRVGTHGIATQVANEDTAFAGTDPVLAKMTLNAYDSGQLVALANNFVEDAGVNVLGFVAENIGRAIGEHTATWYVTGSGSGQPNGVMTAVTGAGTIATGGSLIDPTFEKLIDLVYSVADSYRSRGAEWLMRDLTASVIRKIRDGAGGTTGAFIWQPSPTVGLQGGQPDLLLGYPVFTDPNVASLASNAKVIAYGDFSAYYIRDVRGLRLERSDDLLFNKNQTAFRGLLRTDGDLIDSNAVNIIKRSV